MSSLEDIKNKAMGKRDASPSTPIYVNKVKETKLEINIKDTEFIMRLFQNSGISGGDIEQAYATYSKIKDYHKTLLEKTLEV